MYNSPLKLRAQTLLSLDPPEFSKRFTAGSGAPSSQPLAARYDQLRALCTDIAAGRGTKEEDALPETRLDTMKLLARALGFTIQCTKLSIRENDFFSYWQLVSKNDTSYLPVLFSMECD